MKHLFNSTVMEFDRATQEFTGSKSTKLNRICWVLFFSLFVFANSIFAQDFQDDWHLKVPSWDSYYYGYSEYEYSKVVGDTLYLFSEYYGDSIEVDPGPTELWIDDDDNAHLSGIIFVAKYSVSTGNFLGAKKLIEIPTHLNGSMTVMQTYDYEVTPNGKLIVIGACVNGVDFDGSSASAGFYGSATAVSFASFYESDGSYTGHIEYDLNYSGSPFSSAHNNAFDIYQVAVDANENIYLVGSILGDVDLDFTAGTDVKTSNGNYDAAIVKVDGISETYAWSISMGGTSSEYIAFAGTYQNDLIVIGAYGSASIDLDPSLVSFNIANPMTCCDWTFMAKYNGSGNFINGGAIGGDTELNFNDFNIDADGSIHLLASLDNDIPFDLDPGAANIDPHFQDFLVNYNLDFSVSSVASFNDYGIVEKISSSTTYTALFGYLDPAEELIVHSSVTSESDTISAGADGGMFIVPMGEGSLSLGTPAIYKHSYNRYSYPYTGTNDALGNFYFSGTFSDAIDFTAFDGIDSPDTATFAINNVQEVFVAKLIWTGFVEIDEFLSQESGLQFYPNPTDAEVYINGEEIITEVNVFDMSGRLIKTIYGSNKTSETLNLVDQSEGCYFVQIKLVSGNTHTIKLVKK